VILGHIMALEPTPEQAAYLRRARGFAYKWGLAEWKRMFKPAKSRQLAPSSAAGARTVKPNCRGHTRSSSAPAGRLSWTLAPRCRHSSVTTRTQEVSALPLSEIH
jgi:hypothetical protein